MLSSSQAANQPNLMLAIDQAARQMYLMHFIFYDRLQLGPTGYFGPAAPKDQ